MVAIGQALDPTRRERPAGCYGEVPTSPRRKGSPDGRRTPTQLGGHGRAATRPRPRDAARRRVQRGGLRQAAGRRRLELERGHALQLPPRQARRAREGRRPPGRRRADRVHDDRRERRHRDGSRGHEGVADEPRPDRRLGRARDARRAHGRARRHRRLRQERARHADGDGPPEPAERVPLRRHDPAGYATKAATSRSRTSSRPSARTPRARSTTRSSAASSAPRARARARAPACTRRTRWPPSARRSACRCRAPRRRPRSTTGARSLRASRASQAATLLADGGPLPRDIMTKEAFENAIAVVMALAGSTNAVLHLLAIAREAARRPAARRLRPRSRATCRTSSTCARPAGS